MFLSYYNLQTNPFKISSDPKFLWMGEKHKEALATLTYGISDNKGFLLLTGDVGSGKTTLINTLLNNLDDNVIVAVISDPGLSPIDFFNHIAHLFNFKKKFQSKGDFIIHFSMFLNGVYMANKKVLLIIDEAQRMPHELLEEVRLLSNIEKQDTKLINIFFVGQNEFNNMLLKESNRALRQRLALNYHIDSLDERETSLYIQHRLKVAGGKVMLFTPEAILEIFKYSGGYPRQINIICDLALLSGYVKGIKTIGEDIIKECVRELNIPEKIVKKTSHKDEEKNTFQTQKSSNDIESQQPIHYESKPPRRRSGKTGYLLAIFFISIFILFSYVLLFHPQNMNSMVNGVQQNLTVLYTTLLEMTTSQHPKNAVTSDSSTPLESSDAVRPEMSTSTGTIQEPVKTTQTSESTDMKKESESHKTPIEASAATPESQVSQNSSGEQKISDIDMILNNQKSLPETEENKIDKTQSAQQEQDAPAPDKDSPTIKEQTSTSPTEVNADPAYLKRKVTISFGYNSNDLTLENRQELIKLVQLLKEDRTKKIRITGHSDSIGNASYNMQLSEFRANIVKSFMFGSGAEPDQLIVVGKGGTEPVGDNTNVQGRQMNRRVELEFILP